MQFHISVEQVPYFTVVLFLKHGTYED